MSAAVHAQEKYFFDQISPVFVKRLGEELSPTFILQRSINRVTTDAYVIGNLTPVVSRDQGK